MAKNSKKEQEEKKVSQAEDKAPEVNDEAQLNPENQENAEKEQPEDKAPENQEDVDGEKAEDKAPEKPKKAKDSKDEIPAFVDEILKSHTDYSELYIDSLGGIYAPGTPEPVRGKAKLYKNKYHK